MPDWTKLFSFIAVLFFGVLITLTVSRAKSINIILYMPLIAICILLATYVVVSMTKVYISPSSSLFTIFVVWLLLTALRFYFEERKAYHKSLKLNMNQAKTINSMASVAETRDPETGGHIIRTQEYIRVLCDYFINKGMYKEELNAESAHLIYLSAPLHDIGKVGIPDRILLKPGKLTHDEFEIMKGHSQMGADIVSKSEGDDDDFLYYAKEIAQGHHEKWDGTGYPDGKKGEEIPLAARMMALADVYDALVSKRHYKEAMSHEEAMRIILEGRGSHFDPDIVDAFVDVNEFFVNILYKYRDKN